MIIRKGTHAPLRLPEIIWKPGRLSFNVMFTSSCAYYIGENQSDINKLFGIGYLPHHLYNSVRFGWRYASGNYVDIFAYFYIEGKREWQLIGMVEINVANTFVITAGQSSHSFQVLGKGINCRVPLKSKGIGYLLGPYFGGNEVAPHDIEIVIDRI